MVDWMEKAQRLRLPRAETRIDLYLVFFVFLLGVIVSSFLLSKSDLKGEFYQRAYAPAVLMTCGHGFTNIKLEDSGPTAPLNDFVYRKTQTFECSQLPETIEPVPLRNLQSMHMYLMAAVSLVWGVVGISWQKLLPLFAVFYGMSCAVSYLVFRLGANRAFSLIGAGLFMFSFWHFEHLQHLRDYSKAPFMLAALLVSAWLVGAQELKARRWLSVLLGVVVGVGLGVRFDILLFVPFVVLTIFFFSSTTWSWTGIVEKLRLTALFLFTMMLVGEPIFSLLDDGQSNTFHVILLGLSPYVGQSLELQGGQELLTFYNDLYLLHSVSAWSSPVFGSEELFELATPEYEAAAAQYWFTLASYFPADFFVGGLAAIRKILLFPYEYGHDIFDYVVYREYLGGIPEAWRYALYAIPVLASLYMVGKTLRTPLFIVFAITYICGSAFLQFNLRHFFYLEMIPFWLGVMLLQVAFAVAMKSGGTLAAGVGYWLRHKKLDYRSALPWRRMKLPQVAILAATIFVAPYLVLSLTSALQDWRSLSLQRDYWDLPLTGVPVEGIQVNHSVKYAVNWEALHLDNGRPLNAVYLAVDFDPTLCQETFPVLALRYEASGAFYDFSNSFIPSQVQAKRYFFPILKWHDYRFASLDVWNETSRCIRNVAMMRPEARPPLALNLSVPLKREEITPLAGRRFKGSGGAADDVSEIWWVTQGVESKEDYFEGTQYVFEPINHFVYVDRTFVGGDREARFTGKPISHTAYLARFETVREAGGKVLRLEGYMEEGIVNFGILGPNEQWTWVYPINRKGPFRVLVAIPQGHAPLLAANMQPNESLSFVITRADWVKP